MILLVLNRNSEQKTILITYIVFVLNLFNMTDFMLKVYRQIAKSLGIKILTI